MAVDKGKSLEKLLTDGGILYWGSPPLALIPEALADRLSDVHLPEWLAELLDGPTSSAGALTARAWSRLPEDDAIRQRASSYALRVVTAHTSELRDVPISGPVRKGLDSLELGRWPTRARNALLRSGVSQAPWLLKTLTFGDLLGVGQSGVKTVLEIAALFELFLPCVSGFESDDGADADSLADDGSAITVPRWGEPGSPLLPQTLRRALATEVLPAWLLQGLHLPPETTALALDASVWRHLDALPLRAERFLLGLLMYRAEELRDLRVIDGGWPAAMPPEAVPWPTRVHNALVRGNLLEPARLQRLTYGELLDLSAMGVKSVLEFAAIADSVATATAARVLDETTRQDLMSAVEEEWAERVRADDPRFRDVVPPYRGSLSEMFEDALNNPEGLRAHAMAESLPRIRVRAEEIASEPIDTALVRLLRSAGVSERDIAIAAARLGWRADGRRTLQEVGK